MRACIALLLLLATALCHAQLSSPADTAPFGAPGTQPTFLPVDEAYQIAIEVGENGGLRAYWQIHDGYYLYQHRFQFTLAQGRDRIAVEADLPEALEREDEYFGQVKVYYHSADIALSPARRPAGETTLAVTYQGCADAGLCYPPTIRYFAVNLDTGETRSIDAVAGNTVVTVTDGGTDAGLLTILLLAALGGAILNLMPCVFPVLSLKVLGFARSSEADRHAQAWIYALGVVSSFVLVAGVLIALQQAGRAVGWGFQLQSPGFVIALAYLFVVMGLALSGWIHLGAGLMNTGGELAGRGGLSGSFFTGVLAVVVASPCTAPFMGTALGYAVARPPATALLVFAALGVGMAAPLLALSYSAVLRRFMPRPGPWMQTLQQLLAFPLYATAIWLFWVAGKQAGVDTMAAALAGALLLVLGLWLWRGSNWAKGVAALCILGALGLGAWRGEPPRTVAPTGDSGFVAWSESEVRARREAGQAVFVDVTADWCITCIANEQAVLYTAEIRDAFERAGVTYMVADWTRYDADIADLLRRHGRTGIPLYLLYPADPELPAQTLPQLLTKSTILEALQAVAPGKGLRVAAGEREAVKI